MIIWLDNQTNHKGAINENYGREVLELFSMGAGNYSEADIKECARAFTGWTVRNAEYMALMGQKTLFGPMAASCGTSSTATTTTTMKRRCSSARGVGSMGGHNRHHLPPARNGVVHRPAPVQLLRRRRGPRLTVVLHPAQGPRSSEDVGGLVRGVWTRNQIGPPNALPLRLLQGSVLLPREESCRARCRHSADDG